MNMQMNPFMLAQLLQQNNGNVAAVAMQLLQNSPMAQTPIGQNLMQLARTNNVQGVEQVARNLCAQKGLDYDAELQKLSKQFGFYK